MNNEIPKIRGKTAKTLMTICQGLMRTFLWRTNKDIPELQEVVLRWLEAILQQQQHQLTQPKHIFYDEFGFNMTVNDIIEHFRCLNLSVKALTQVHLYMKWRQI